MRLVLAFFYCFSLLADFNAQDYYGKETYENGQLIVVENDKQTHSKDRYIFVNVKNIPINDLKPESRIRVAIWNKSDNYASEEVAPYRASSISANIQAIKEKGSVRFKFGIGENDSRLSIFIHFDTNNIGKVERNWLRYPKDPYKFSSKENGDGCPGLKTNGLFSQPNFNDTLISVSHEQLIDMCF